MRVLFRVFIQLALLYSGVDGQIAWKQPYSVSAEDAPGASVTVRTVNTVANDFAWDSINKKIYLSLPSTAGTNGNSIQVLDPSTGQLGANAFAGSEPSVLSVSATSKYLYVGLKGSSNVQRMTLPSLGTDIKFALPTTVNGSTVAIDLQASPVTDTTVAVGLGVMGISPTFSGVVIYDNAVARPTTICGWSPTPG